MAGRNYPRENIKTFGTRLIESGDLDPIYIALYKMNMPLDQLKRWLVAYWCLYSAGAASYLSEREGVSFWAELHRAADNSEPAPTGGRWPRGHERRHWRGQQAIKAVTALRSQYNDPVDMVNYIQGEAAHDTFANVNKRAMEHRSFGPWISFKVADMLDRLGMTSVEFSMTDAMYEGSPTKAAIELFDLHHDGRGDDPGMPEYLRGIPDITKIQWSVEFVQKMFADRTAPPRHERPIGFQEVETILCKWKSSLSGHYPPYNDIIEIRDGALPWVLPSPTAGRFMEVLPREP